MMMMMIEVKKKNWKQKGTYYRGVQFGLVGDSIQFTHTQTERQRDIEKDEGWRRKKKWKESLQCQVFNRYKSEWWENEFGIVVRILKGRKMSSFLLTSKGKKIIHIKTNKRWGDAKWKLRVLVSRAVCVYASASEYMKKKARRKRGNIFKGGENDGKKLDE